MNQNLGIMGSFNNLLLEVSCILPLPPHIIYKTKRNGHLIVKKWNLINKKKIPLNSSFFNVGQNTYNRFFIPTFSFFSIINCNYSMSNPFNAMSNPFNSSIEERKMGISDRFSMGNSTLLIFPL